MDEQPIAFSELADTANRIVATTEARGVHVRVLGSVAVAFVCQRATISPKSVRSLWKDLDLVCTGDGYAIVKEIVADIGYTPDASVELASDGRRSLFRRRDGLSFPIDLFIDPVELCHRIHLGKRLALSDLTLTPSDLLLTKIQRINLTSTDRMDVCLLMAVSCSNSHRQVLEPSYIASVLSGDWGFWKTARDNVSSIVDAPCDIRGAMLASEWSGLDFEQAVSDTARSIIRAIDSSRKTLRWHLRSMIGSSMQWYQTVDSPDVF